MSEEDLSQFCVGRFAPLTTYLTGIFVSDLVDEDRDVILDSVHKKHWLLMLAFWKQHIVRAVPQIRYDGLTLPPASVPAHDLAAGLCWNPEKGVLSVPGLVSSLGSDRRQMRVEELRAVLQSAGIADAVRVLDLSGHFFRDVDMAHVESAVAMLNNCSILILRNNMFHGATSPFKEQLDSSPRRILAQRDQIR